MPIMNIAVLVSGGGSNLQAIIDAISAGIISSRIVAVISNKRDAYALQRAELNGIPAIYIDRKLYSSNNEFDNAIIKKLEEYDTELVVLAGYLRILGREFIQRYRNRIINIHPSLIPSFCGKGYYGKHVHQAALDYGVKITGATVHFVDEDADTGPIILQESVMINQDDDADTLASRVLEIEHRLLPRAVELLTNDRVSLYGRKVIMKDEFSIVHEEELS